MAYKSDVKDREQIKEFADLLDGDWSTAARFASINRSFCIVELTTEGKLLHANAKFRELFGYERDELIGRNHSMLCFPSTVESSEYVAFWAKLRAGGYVDDVQLRRCRDGSPIWLQAVYTPVLNTQGRVERILKVAMDVTIASSKAIEAQNTMDAINRSSGVVHFQLDGTIIDANIKFAHALGYEPDEIIGRPHKMLCDEEYAESREYADFWERLRSGEYFAGRFERRRRNGRTVTIRASYNPIFGPHGKITKILKVCHTVPLAELEISRAA